MEPILQAEGLCFAYDGHKNALDGVSLAVYPGERIAVLGCNGAGKSTFFLCLNGVLTPTAGTLRLHGRPLGKRDRAEQCAAVGVVFQNPDDQILAATVETEVSFGPMNLRLPREAVARRVDEAIDYMAGAYRRRPAHALSGGEKKRVTIADVLAMQSDVLLLDEPAASLDPAGADLLEDVLDRLHESGKTLLISTHDMDFAHRWADRVIVFAEGRILADGTPAAVFAQTAVLAQARLRPPMLMTVFGTLRARGLVPAQADCPRTARQFEALLG